MKQWIAAALALLLVLSVCVLPAQAAKEKQEKQETQTETIETEAQTEPAELETQAETVETEAQTEPAELETQAETAETEASAETAEPDAPINVAPAAPELEKKPLYDTRSPASSRLTTDTVTIDEENGFFTVVTASGTEMSVTVPFGADCITQDVSQQLDIYMSLYSDISAALEYYVSHGIHMDILDFYSGASTYIIETDNALAALVGDLNDLEGSQSKKIADYMSKRWYGGTPASLKVVGENRYIAFDLSKEYGYVVYNHFTNDKLIEIYTFCEKGTEGMKRLESMIEDLTFGPAEAAEDET